LALAGQADDSSLHLQLRKSDALGNWQLHGEALSLPILGEVDDLGVDGSLWRVDPGLLAVESDGARVFGISAADRPCELRAIRPDNSCEAQDLALMQLERAVVQDTGARHSFNLQHHFADLDLGLGIEILDLTPHIKLISLSSSSSSAGRVSTTSASGARPVT